MNKKKIKIFMLMGWMIIIFLFSHQPAEISNQNNEFVVYLFNLLGIDLNSLLGEIVHYIIRKAAHFTEYFILFILFYNVFKEDKSFSKSLIYSLIGVFLYACSDEFHQLFVEGRSGKFTDVLIDTGGGLAALMVTYCGVTFKKKSSN